jgi:hypothetical protein
LNAANSQIVVQETLLSAKMKAGIVIAMAGAAHEVAVATAATSMAVQVEDVAVEVLFIAMLYYVQILFCNQRISCTDIRFLNPH